MVFQAACLLPWLTALENVRLAVDQARPDLRRNERSDIAVALLRRLGLGDQLHKHPRELSAGMRQRVGLARALALDPKILLLDEPFGMLDGITRMELQEVLLDIWERRRITALMVTHDVDEALFLADRVVMMTNGPEARVGDVVDVMFPRPRRREELLNDPEYYRLRERLIGFLEEQESHRADRSAPGATPSTGTGRSGSLRGP
jgi:ABC-type nitrate/sulfonate/bicarbonate transport system ATPase subunit